MMNNLIRSLIPVIVLPFLSLAFWSCAQDEVTTDPEINKLKADFTYVADRLTVQFNNTSVNAVIFNWTFGDTYHSHDKNPVHLFDRSGSYDIRLVAIDSLNLTDTIIKSIQVVRMDTTPNPDFTIINPYKNYANWYRGQMHMHTNDTVPPDDGNNSAAEMVQVYKEKEYDFVSITSHEMRMTDPGIEGILFIHGEELTAVYPDGGGHSNIYNIQEKILPHTAIEQCIAIGSTLAQANHPTRSSLNSYSLNQVDGLWAIEIANYYNKKPGDLMLWDSQISQGKAIWCNAGDDMHDTGDAGHNSTMVNSPELTLTEILKNLKTGNFYITEGPDMSLSVEGKKIICSTTNGSKIRWYKNDLILISSDDSNNSFYIPFGNEVFVRVEVEDANGRIAYSQPFFLQYD
jgi:PKD repeat protein